MKKIFNDGVIEVEGILAPPKDGRPLQVRLLIRQTHPTYTRAVNFEITQFTGPEVEELQKIITWALEEAVRIAYERDHEAKENYENGEDPDPRLYRTVARIIEIE